MSEGLSHDLTSFTTPIGASIAPTRPSNPSNDALGQFHAEQEEWQPRTQLGKRLKELRAKFIAEGGQLLSDEEIEKELRGDQDGGWHHAGFSCDDSIAHRL